MIDIGESLLAVIGMRSVMSQDVERVTAPMWNEARSMDSKVRLLAAKLVLGTLDGENAGGAPVNYDRMLDELVEPPAIPQLMAMIESFPPDAHDEAGAFLMTAGRAYQYLRGLYPVDVDRQLLGGKNLPPSDMALTAFEFVLEAVDRPLSAFDLLDSGALLSTQAKALAACFPTLTRAVIMAILERITRERVREPEYEPPFSLALSTLMGAPYIDPKTSAAMGAASQMEQAKQQQAQQGQPQPSSATAMTAPPSARSAGESR